MTDLKFAFRQLLKNPGCTTVAQPGGGETMNSGHTAP